MYKLWKGASIKMQEKQPVLPYFMTYPLPKQIEQPDRSLNDRDYMRYLYPQEAKNYLTVIVDVLDRVDFKESYIYDEYPDYLTLLRLTEIILRQIPMRKNTSRQSQRELVQILLYDEIIRRRQIQ